MIPSLAHTSTSFVSSPTASTLPATAVSPANTISLSPHATPTDSRAVQVHLKPSRRCARKNPYPVPSPPGHGLSHSSEDLAPGFIFTLAHDHVHVKRAVGDLWVLSPGYYSRRRSLPKEFTVLKNLMPLMGGGGELMREGSVSSAATSALTPSDCLSVSSLSSCSSLPVDMAGGALSPTVVGNRLRLDNMRSPVKKKRVATRRSTRTAYASSSTPSSPA